MMHPFLAIAPLALAATLATRGAIACPPQEAPAATAPAAQGGSLEDRYKAIVQEYDVAQKKFMTEYRAAKTDEERQALMPKYPDAGAFGTKLLALAKESPKDAAALDCVLWVLRNQQGKHDAGVYELLTAHLDDKKMSQACDALQGDGSAAGTAFLRQVLAKSGSDEIKGHACYALAKSVQSQARFARMLADSSEETQGLEQYLGKEETDRLRKAKPEALEAEAVQLLETCRDTYPRAKFGTGTLAKQAKTDLFELQNLAVGKPAPEIEGEDVDGAKFKLSDYRGKVVFLDFWGFW